MSDSILYLAIVAIWAGFLIPAWVRRPHSAKPDYDSESGEFEFEGAFEAEVTTQNGTLAESATVSESMVVTETAILTSDTTNYPAYTADDMAVDMDAHVYVEVRHGNSEYRDDVHTHNYDPAEPRFATATTDRRSAPQPSQSREQMMRARRRMLTILAGLTLLTAAFVLTGVVQWWICVPPVAMLVLYVLLLREISMADAELATKRRAWEARQAGADKARSGWQRSHEVWEAEAEPTAEIIDISSRVGDQLYDQYADAAVRAVGD